MRQKLVDPFSPLPRPRPAARPDVPSPPSPPKRGRKFAKYLVILAVPVFIVGLSRLAQFLTAGEAAIGVYAIAALLLHIPSRVTFSLACLSLISVALQLIIRPDTISAENTAVFAFLFLVAGTLSLALEARHTRPQPRYRR